MFRTGKLVAAVALVGASVWAGLTLAAQEPKPAAGAKPADLSALREAVAGAAKSGENVDEIRKALDAFEKALPGAKSGEVPQELRALRDVVEAAARKGENVDAVLTELAAVEKAIVGRSLAKPKPKPVPQPDVLPDPFNLPDGRFPVRPLPPLPPLPGGGRIDLDAVQRATDLRMNALERLARNPGDAEARKMMTEANQLMLKALPLGNGGALFPDIARVPERARFGVRLEQLSDLAAEQLDLAPDVGVAVTGVIPGSIAERAGVRAHDIILEFAGKPASASVEEFIRQVNGTKADEKFDLVVMRKGKKVKIAGVVLPGTENPPAPVRPVPAVPKTVPPVPAVPERAVPEKGIDAPVDVRADVPEATNPDLGDLRDAVTAAEKRGENVGAVRAALDALEKALAKGAAKPGAAPPELTALREAVEAAAKKGEHVAPISKELGSIEKALTGREYERPKIEEPRPAPPFSPRRGNFGAGGRVGLGVKLPEGFSRMSVRVVNDLFIATAQKGGCELVLSGTIGENGLELTRAVITEGEKKVQVESLEKVPAEHKPAVEALLKLVNRG